MLGIGTYGGELSGPKQSRELFSIAAIGLHAVTGLHGDECRSNDVASNIKLRELPVDDVTARSGLIANVQAVRASELADPTANGITVVRDGVKRPDLATGFGNRDGDRLLVNIEPHESRTLRH